MKMTRDLGEVGEGLHAGLGVGHEDLRILLEDRGDRDHRDVLLDGVERAEQVAVHVEVDLAAEQHGALGLAGLRSSPSSPYFS